jgi:DUF4097 and DUF4098 domain-containing protein YvlB
MEECPPVPARASAASSSSGCVAVNGAEVESARVRVSSGDVDLADLRGPVTLEVASGEVTAERLDAPTSTASSSSGDLTLDFATPPSSVYVEACSGEVALALLADGRYRLEVETGAGEETVRVPSGAAASGTVRIETGSGDVDVRPR